MSRGKFFFAFACRVRREEGLCFRPARFLETEKGEVGRNGEKNAVFCFLVERKCLDGSVLFQKWKDVTLAGVFPKGLWKTLWKLCKTLCPQGFGACAIPCRFCRFSAAPVFSFFAAFPKCEKRGGGRNRSFFLACHIDTGVVTHYNKYISI